jgi:hypothetical protein
MYLNIRLAIVAGVIWGIVAILLSFLQQLLGNMLPVEQAGITLAGFAIMFASVHYVVRSKGGLLEHIIGGILAAILAGLFLMLVSRFLPGAAPGNMTNDLVGVLVTGVVAGLLGAIGIGIVNRINF